MENDDKKVPLVLYSGGLDSYCLAMELLAVGDIDTLTIVSDCINRPRQREAEATARANFFDWVAGWDEECNYKGRVKEKNYAVIPTFTDTPGYNSHPYLAQQAFGQAASWLSQVLLFVNPYKHTSVEIAYVTGDEIAYYANRLQNAWADLYSALNPHRPLVPLNFRFLENNDTKENLEKRHISEYDYYNCIWYCENPEPIDGLFYVCNRCPSCKRMAFSEHHQTRVLKHKVKIEEMSQLKKENHDDQTVQAS